MMALIKKNLRIWGWGKVLAAFGGCLIFASSGRSAAGRSYEQHLLSAAADHYYLTYFWLPILLLSCFSVMEDDGGMVILRFRSYRAYFWRKWLSVGLIALALVAVQSAAIGLSGLGLPPANQWELPAGAVDEELFVVFKPYFSAPLQAFSVCTLYQFCGSWIILGICMWLGHFGGRKWSIRLILALYLLSAVWIKLPFIQKLPLTGFDHLLILHHNLGSSRRLAITVLTIGILALLIMVTIQKTGQGGVSLPRRPVWGMTTYYSRELVTQQNLLLLGVVVLMVVLYKGLASSQLESGQAWVYTLFAGHGTGYFRVLPFLEMLIINGAPLYLLAVFVEQTVSGRSLFIAVRAKSGRHMLGGIVSAGTTFLAGYALLWLGAGSIGLLFWGWGGETAAWKMLSYAVVMKFLDLWVQYLVMMGLYAVTKQITISFLVLAAGNLLCIIPQPWAAYVPFGLSSLTRIREMSGVVGISAVFAGAVEAALAAGLLIGLFVAGWQKILD